MFKFIQLQSRKDSLCSTLVSLHRSSSKENRAKASQSRSSFHWSYWGYWVCLRWRSESTVSPLTNDLCFWAPDESFTPPLYYRISLRRYFMPFAFDVLVCRAQLLSHPVYVLCGYTFIQTYMYMRKHFFECWVPFRVLFSFDAANADLAWDKFTYVTFVDNFPNNAKFGWRFLFFVF